MLEDCETPREPLPAYGLNQLLENLPSDEYESFVAGLIHLKISQRKALKDVQCLDAKSPLQVCRNWVSEEILHLNSESTRLVMTVCEDLDDCELAMVS